MSENCPITFEGAFVGRYKKSLILRQNNIEALIDLFQQAIPPYDEGCLEITRINLNTGRIMFIKEITFCNELYFYNKKNEEDDPNLKEPKETPKDLSLYRLRWSEK